MARLPAQRGAAARALMPGTRDRTGWWIFSSLLALGLWHRVLPGGKRGWSTTCVVHVVVPLSPTPSTVTSTSMIFETSTHSFYAYPRESGLPTHFMRFLFLCSLVPEESSAPLSFFSSLDTTRHFGGPPMVIRRSSSVANIFDVRRSR